MRSLAIAILAILAAGAGGRGAKACEVRNTPFSSLWQETLGCNHPLCATGIWLTAPADAERCDVRHEIEAGRLATAAARNGVELLGETHDNARHHVLRAALLRARVEQGGGRPAVVFEQLRADQQPAIDAFMAQPKPQRTLDAFLDVIEWAKSGWAQYDYKPLFDAVLRAELPIYAGDPPRDLVRKAAKEGPSALAAEELKRLHLDRPLGDKNDGAMLDELEKSHCGLMPRTAFANMAFAQRLRDATIADAALRARAKHGAVIVFAGNGHARNDRGVGWYIASRAPGVAVSTTQLLEVEEGKTDAAQYVPRDPDGKAAADYIAFTPRAERPDPCEEMRKSFGKAR